MMVIVNLETLAAESGGVGYLDNGVAITGDAARRLACDAGVSRVITKGSSEALDLGRQTPVPSPALRRYVAARDGGCVFAGCDQPASRCEAHHLVHYARGCDTGGSTSAINLAMVCPRHHRLIHEGGFHMGRNPITGQIETRRPDGTLLPTRPRTTPLNPSGHRSSPQPDLLSSRDGDGTGPSVGAEEGRSDTGGQWAS
jgi:hypothetical protein